MNTKRKTNDGSEEIAKTKKPYQSEFVGNTELHFGEMEQVP
ncbi:hypothetical protein RO3G_09810 [Rhizopus delemar RA 99-880]|uniref:Uncharacterized protein n=1 Tax=Rhizopus delemar (strain RA 99-880 / ATCC MYA-4621 / FGSC 9543 / NRRL 43880) TaxID=246409 RepID=I1C9H0_RHIO9|nr:hypothetical protein RO3G_09810 [Rhizopus delemar RA 99-880]|eukprot:EIE85100.1 hypothetical protein RO3G_09810 [Rhizopus delemar RA 99-880]